MKRTFISAVAVQTGNFDSVVYTSTQDDLKNEQSEHYPIFCAMENVVEPNDEVELIAIKFPSEALDRNYKILCERAVKFGKEHDVKVTVTPIEHMSGESKETHDALFCDLIDKIDDCSAIYADITYGTKPTPMILFALLCFIDSVRINSDVKQIVYGEIKWRRAKADAQSEIASAHIYDVTRLLNIISITESMRAFGGDDIEKAVKLLLGVESGD